MPNWFYLFRIYMMSINVITNPFIYVGTMEGFRTFVGNILRCSWTKIAAECETAIVLKNGKTND